MGTIVKTLQLYSPRKVLSMHFWHSKVICIFTDTLLLINSKSRIFKGYEIKLNMNESIANLRIFLINDFLDIVLKKETGLNVQYNSDWLSINFTS